jgi:hypothetical protein
MRHIIRLESGLILLSASKVLSQHQPVQHIECLALRLIALLHKRSQLYVVFELVIGTVGVHQVQGVVERLPNALVVPHGVQILSQARVNVTEPHTPEEGPEDDKLSFHSEDAILLN